MKVEIQERAVFTLSTMPEGTCTTLILDSGQDPNILRTLYHHEQIVQYYPLMDPKLAGDAAFNGPIIACVPNNSNFIDYFLNTPLAGILIISLASLEDITEHSRTIFYQMMDLDPTLFRFFDTRVLVDLAKISDKNIDSGLFKDTVISFYGVNADGEILKFSSSIINKETEPGKSANFKLTHEIADSLASAHRDRVLGMLSAQLASEIEPFRKLSRQHQTSFMDNAERCAREFGIKDFDDLILFSTSWFYVDAIMQNSQEAMNYLKDSDVTKSDKISFLYYHSIISYNASQFNMCPIAMLARCETYLFFQNRIKFDGERIPLDLIHEKDRIPRMYYSSQYEKFTQDSLSIFKAYGHLIKTEHFSHLSKRYNPYTSRFAVLENELSDRIKKELFHGI